MTMLIAVILAIIFVPLLFILGVKTGMEQCDNKWIKIMKENTTDSQTTITKLQSKLKKKNEEISRFKEKSKVSSSSIEELTKELNLVKSDNIGLTTKVKELTNKQCIEKGGLIMDDSGKYYCPLKYKAELGSNPYL